MPRRYHAYPDEYQVLHVLSTAGATVLALGYLMPAVYFLWSLRYGEIASANPWELPVWNGRRPLRRQPTISSTFRWSRMTL